MKTQNTQAERLKPSKDSYRYPNIPSKLLIGWDEKPRQLLQEANSRGEIVAWADANNMIYVQNVGREAFLLSDIVGSGRGAWFLYLYVPDGSRWRLLYIGSGGLKPLDHFECAYFDHSNRAICFAKRDGKVVATLQIGHEMDLLKRKH
jgi:hypothetical protein